MTRSRRSSATCSRCGARTPAKRLTGLPGEAVCPKCFDRIPYGVRRTLLRRAAREAHRVS